MRLPKIPKELDPRRRFRKKKTTDAPRQPRAYGQHVEVDSDQDEIRAFERATGEVVREGDNVADAAAAGVADEQKSIHEMESFEKLTDEPVRER